MARDHGDVREGTGQWSTRPGQGRAPGRAGLRGRELAEESAEGLGERAGGEGEGRAVGGEDQVGQGHGGFHVPADAPAPVRLHRGGGAPPVGDRRPVGDRTGRTRWDSELLAQAVRHLERSPARYGHAMALVDLGGAPVPAPQARAALARGPGRAAEAGDCGRGAGAGGGQTDRAALPGTRRSTRPRVRPPGPTAAISRKAQQNITAGSPPFWMGHRPCSWCTPK